MPSFDKTFRPDIHEGGNTALQEGKIYGWVIGIVTDVKDLESIGRIKCRIPLFDDSTDMPNSDDVMIWVGEEYTCANSVGGSHKLIEVDNMVALEAMLGDPRQLLVIAQIPNRKDRPHPELDRSKGIYGSVTRSGVASLNDEGKQAKVDAFPHGVTSQISNMGTVTTQTLKGATNVLSWDGNVLVENPAGSMTIAPDGKITQQNKAGAIATLLNDGNIILKNPQEAKLDLLKQEAKLIGPKSKMGGLMGMLQMAMGGQVGMGMMALEALQELSGGKFSLDNLGQISGVMDSLTKGIGKTFQEGLGSVTEMLKLPMDEFTDHIVPQVQSVLDKNLPGIAGELKGVLAKDLNFDGMLGEVNKVLSGSGFAMDESVFKDLQQSMGFDKNLLSKGILGEIIPGGFESISSIANMNLLEILDKVDDLLDVELPVAQITEQLKELWPKDSKNLISDEVVSAALLSEDPTASLIGGVQKGMLGDLKEKLSSADKLVGGIPKIDGILQGMLGENLNKIYANTKGLDEIPEFGDLLGLEVGDTTVGNLGDLDVSDASLAALLGDYNTGGISLESFDAATAIDNLNLGKINLRDIQVGNVTLGKLIDDPKLHEIKLSDLLGGIDLGRVDLGEILDRKIANIDFDEIKLGDLMEMPTLTSVADLDLGGLTLENLTAPQKVDLSEVPINSLLMNMTGDINLADALGLPEQSKEKVKDINLKDIILGEDLGKADLGKLNLNHMIAPEGKPIGKADLNNINLGLPIDTDLSKMLKTAIDPLTTKLSGMFDNINNSLDKTLDSLPLGGGGGALVRLQQKVGLLESLNGKFSLFADMSGAGIKTPAGKFKLGGGGGGALMQGAAFAMRMLQSKKDSKKGAKSSAGIAISAEKGASLVSYPAESKDTEDTPLKQWTSPLAEVKVYEDTVKVYNSKHRISVLPEGVFVDEVNLSTLLHTLFDRINALESRIQSLESRLPVV